MDTGVSWKYFSSTLTLEITFKFLYVFWAFSLHPSVIMALGISVFSLSGKWRCQHATYMNIKIINKSEDETRTPNPVLASRLTGL